jgi:hypothetical protein
MLAGVDPGLRAYIDESLRVADGLYVMAAVIIGLEQEEPWRAALRDLLYRRQRRLHWRDENELRRASLISAVTEMRPSGVVVIGAGMEPGRQERARRKCAERLLWEVTRRGVHAVVFERRHDELDARDRVMASALIRRRVLPAGLRASWTAAINEPLLWLADIVAGAAAAAGTDRGKHWEQIEARFAAERVDLRS